MIVRPLLLLWIVCPFAIGFCRSAGCSHRTRPSPRQPASDAHLAVPSYGTGTREWTKLLTSQRRHCNYYYYSRETSRLWMVFDSISPEMMEKISTQDVLDRILDESLRTSARRPIMIQFDPSSRAIWRHWKGTVFQETWQSALRHALWAVVVYALFQQYPRIQSAFAGFHVIWAQILGVTTFTLTFFVNQSYAIWCRILQVCRELQGRLNDYLLAAAGLAQRNEDVQQATTTTTTAATTLRRKSTASQFTETSRKLLSLQARYVRLFTILLYASLTRSHRPLLTPQGLRRMVSRGIMTHDERIILKQAAVPANSRHNVVLMWLFRTHLQGCKAGVIEGGAGLEVQLIGRVQEIRGLANGMESVLKGRMPFAYAHIVQVVRCFGRTTIIMGHGCILIAKCGGVCLETSFCLTGCHTSDRFYLLSYLSTPT